MTKAELIDRISEKFDITRVKAEVVVSSVFNSMTEALRNGDRIEIRDFGSFEVRHYDSYTGRNPRNGKLIQVPNKKQAFFRVGKNLKLKLNEK